MQSYPHEDVCTEAAKARAGRRDQNWLQIVLRSVRQKSVRIYQRQIRQRTDGGRGVGEGCAFCEETEVRELEMRSRRSWSSGGFFRDQLF